MRKKIAPEKLRYFLVGEYGDISWRPHYHAILFGLGYWCAPIIEQTWDQGFIKVGDFNEKTAQYCCGYVIKKLTGDLGLEGRHPEFSRQSRRPRLGAAAMAILADTLHTGNGIYGFSDQHDVPYKLQIGTKSVPLGRYLQSKLREAVGMPDHLRESIKSQFMADLTFDLLRHTAVTRLAEATCEVPEIAGITGHSLKTVEVILDTYLVRTAKLARNAFQKRLDAAEREITEDTDDRENP